MPCSNSGVDYTHRNLGGEGTEEAYLAAYGTTITDTEHTTRDGLFPTEKVYEGYDFVGEAWIGGTNSPPLAPDDDPIDAGGHGTHVADIIAGKSADGTHVGVAPGASILAVKVCSAISTSCSGVAMLQGLEYALDPNGDDAIDDAVDVINMSIGSSYGQREDDSAEASANAVRYGVVVVASAGNSADRPYITGSPASTPEVISVAQTQVPSALTYPLVINAPENIDGVYPNTATLEWAPIGDGFTGDVVIVGRGCPAGTVAPGAPADPYLADPAGKVALIDRGACNISAKVRRASDAGAIGVLIGLIAPGDASSFSNGGDCPVPPDGTCKPSLVIIKDYADSIKANLAAPVNISVSPDVTTPLVGSMVGSSARGPSFSYNAIKPDIGAPGGSVSAIAGTGDGEEAFSGTSGAAPMVAGAAVLLVQQFPDRIPAEIKSLLMNTAETNILINPATQPGVLAPITRIGGGELRVDRASSSTSAAWDADAQTGSLSFGFHTVDEPLTLTRQVVVRNYSDQRRTYTIRPIFRYENDRTSGAVTVAAPREVAVGPNGQVKFPVRLRIDPTKLPAWNLDGGPNGGNGALLQGVEFDGYLNLTSGSDNFHLAWQVLPHKASNVDANPNALTLAQSPKELTLNNSGPADGGVEIFAWTGQSERIPRAELPQPGDNYAIIDLRSVGIRTTEPVSPTGVLQVAVNTFGERAHPAYPAEFDVYIDTNLNGLPDRVMYTAESGGFAVTGQTLVYVASCTPTPAGNNITCGTAAANYYIDADLNSANAILTAPLSVLGITAGTKFEYSVYAYDNYFTGALTDQIVLMEFTAGTPRFQVDEATLTVRSGGEEEIAVAPVEGGRQASPSQRGLLLLYRDGLLKKEAETIRVRE